MSSSSRGTAEMRRDEEQLVAARDVHDAAGRRDPQQRDRVFGRRIDAMHEVAQASSSVMSTQIGARARFTLRFAARASRRTRGVATTNTIGARPRVAASGNGNTSMTASAAGSRDIPGFASAPRRAVRRPARSAARSASIDRYRAPRRARSGARCAPSLRTRSREHGAEKCRIADRFGRAARCCSAPGSATASATVDADR